MADSPLTAAPVAPFPLASGKYDVLPGMTLFGTRAVTGEIENGHFRLDRDWARYLADRVRAMEEDPTGVYGTTAGRGSEDECALATLLWRTFGLIAAEQPLLVEPAGLEARLPLLGIAVRAPEASNPANVVISESGRPHALAAPLLPRVLALLERREGLARLAATVALSIQEDLAVLRLGPGSASGAASDVLELTHMAFPGHWDPRVKLGHEFTVVHAPVADNEVILRAAPNIVRAMVSKGPFIRFTTSFPTDNELNHNPNRPHPHPEPIPEWVHDDPAAAAARVFLRWERQTSHPFPDLSRSLFVVHTYVERLMDVAARPGRRAALATALRSMTPATVAYKGLVRLHQPLITWLERDTSDGGG